jgi:hypothetical protein
MRITGIFHCWDLIGAVYLIPNGTANMANPIVPAHWDLLSHTVRVIAPLN